MKNTLAKSMQPEDFSTEQCRVVDSTMWFPFIESHLKGKPVAALRFAVALAHIRQAIESGPDGTSQVIEALGTGIERAFCETHEHSASKRLFELSLIGAVMPEDEPLPCLEPAIARGERELQRVLLEIGDVQEASGMDADSRQQRIRICELLAEILPRLSASK